MSKSKRKTFTGTSIPNRKTIELQSQRLLLQLDNEKYHRFLELWGFTLVWLSEKEILRLVNHREEIREINGSLEPVIAADVTPEINDLVADIASRILLYELGHNVNTTKSPSSNRYIPDSVRLEVMERDNHSCVICGKDTELELDHIIPLSRGGSNTANNLQVLCTFHNRSKGNR